jgi:hypothetical protein
MCSRLADFPLINFTVGFTFVVTVLVIKVTVYYITPWLFRACGYIELSLSARSMIFISWEEALLQGHISTYYVLEIKWAS